MSEKPSAIRPIVRDSARYRILIASVLSLATLIVAGLAFQTWRTARAHRVAAERVLEDYALFAAWSYRSHVNSILLIAPNSVFGGADNVPQQVGSVLSGMRAAADSIQACRCAFDLAPRFVFLIDLRNGSAFTDVRDSALSKTTIDQAVAEIASVSRRSLARGVSSRKPGAVPYRTISGTGADGPWVAIYTVRFRDANDPGAVVGFEMEGLRFGREVFGGAFNSEMLPPSLARGLPNDSLLSIAVTNSRQTAIYRSAAQYKSPFAVTESIGDSIAPFTATLTMNSTAARGMIIGGLPQSPLRTILPLVSLAVALLGLAFYLASRREIVSLELRASLSEARLAALRGQLKPHFLFNVLNTIAMLARKGDNKMVLSALAGLGNLLRKLLNDSELEEIPLREELAFLREYLALEQLRFHGALRVEIESSDALDDALVPSLILQPLVENAVRHGIGGKQGQGVISVRARESDGGLVLEVSDNGGGLARSSELESAGGIGIRNARERLSQLYGKSAKLDVVDSNGSGVRATITMPLIRHNRSEIPA